MRKEDRENLLDWMGERGYEVEGMIKDDVDSKEIIDHFSYTLKMVYKNLESYHQNRKEQIELEKELLELSKHSKSRYFDLKKLNQEFNS